MAKRRVPDADQDLTPMIDVVFQLIIFFIVTIQMEKAKNEDIVLPDGEHGPEITTEGQNLTLVVEVSKRGWISIHGAQLSKQKFRELMRRRYNAMGTFPVLIRGDSRARHEDIRSVMDICTEVGIWRIQFAAIKEKKT